MPREIPTFSRNMKFIFPPLDKKRIPKWRWEILSHSEIFIYFNNNMLFLYSYNKKKSIINFCCLYIQFVGEAYIKTLTVQEIEDYKFILFII